MQLNTIGLDISKTNDLVNDLNELLANFQIYYQNLRGLHWNIKGSNFFELHNQFEVLYTDSQEKIDLIAERVLTLGHSPLHTFSDYIERSKVPVGKNVSKDIDAVNILLDSLKELLTIERSILEKSDELNDEGTNSMMSDFIGEQEKTIWMFSAWKG